MSRPAASIRAGPSDMYAGAWSASRANDGLPAHSVDTLLANLGMLMLNTLSLPGQPDSRFRMTARPTKVQGKAFRLLGINAEKDV